jgi:fido (protein-threonine AMPylation protein)
MGGVGWLPYFPEIPTEQKADEIFNYLRKKFGKCVQFAGQTPLRYSHGRLYFEKVAQLEMTVDQAEEAKKEISKILGCTPERVEEIERY